MITLTLNQQQMNMLDQIVSEYYTGNMDKTTQAIVGGLRHIIIDNQSE